MSLTPSQIDWVVREVVRRLREQGAAPPCDKAAVGGELTIQERVVTAAALEGRLADVAVVRVAPRAVVTPAARDLLYERKIQLVREG